ncbi:MAG TPA: S53 family peptidase [Terriglobales bacterium]|jgi:subtilase family serine protease
MTKSRKFLLAFLVVVITLAVSAGAQTRRGSIIVPSSSIAQPGDAGVKAHTNYVILKPEGVSPFSTIPTGETPASLGCVYKLVQNPVPGCPINGSTSNPKGGAGIIAIVDAFDYPTALQDLQHFSQQFGLPAPKFHKVKVGNPVNDCNWSIEMSLDIEWAHAMAPNAQILLVEANSNFNNDLLAAVDQANQLIAQHGGKGEVTMSWQGGETSNEAQFDSHFAQPGVVYFASSGDSGGVVGWPSVSANVVSAGGTRVNRTNGNFTNETGWSGSGGGPSRFIARPSYQDVVQNIVGTKRGTPDFSYDADPFSGASVYNTNPSCGNIQWLTVGGTSLSSPALAGVVNSTGSFNTSTAAENAEIYSNLGNSSVFTDITSGQAGQFKAVVGWDFVTGVGTDVGKTGK